MIERCGGIVCAGLSLCLVGCSSSKPPPPPPPALTQAAALTAQAQKLSRQNNWSGAVKAWRAAADHYRLLNDLGNLAASLGQLGLAERSQGNYPAAHQALERAAELHQGLNQREAWWTDQIALLQVEAVSGMADSLAARLDRLGTLADEIRDPKLSGLFRTELGLYEQSQGDLAAARGLFLRAQGEFEAIAYRYGVATAQANLARLHEAENDSAGALNLWTQALSAFEELAEPRAITRALAGQGRALLASGDDIPRARELLRRAAENYRTLGMPEDERALLDLLEQQPTNP